METKPCYDLITRMIEYMPKGTDFWSINSLKVMKKLLHNAFYAEVSVQWKSCSEATLCHEIHPEWTRIKWKRRCFSRRGSSLFHQVAVDRGKFNYRAKYSKNRFRSENCRLGCSAIETPQHVFIDCPCNREKLSCIRSKCVDLGIDYNLRNIFSNVNVQNLVENFLHDFVTNDKFYD